MSGCAVGPDGQLLDADKIQWYNDADDDIPISTASKPTTSALNSRPVRTRMPAAKLLGDNAERPLLASHRQAIRAQQERAAKTDALPATPEATIVGNETPGPPPAANLVRNESVVSRPSTLIVADVDESDDGNANPRRPVHRRQ